MAAINRLEPHGGQPSFVSCTKQEHNFMINDDRRANRHRLRRTGKLMHAQEPNILACVIQNMSEDGAMVQLVAGSAIVPHELLLWEDSSKSAFVCQVRWQQGRIVGLRFVDEREREFRQRQLNHLFDCLRHASTFMH